MRVFTVLGPSSSGKSTLVQALAALDASPGKALKIPGTADVTRFAYMGEDWAAIDLPGGAEHMGAVGPALAASDIAVLCLPAETGAAVLAAPYLRRVEEAGIPALIFLNRIDAPEGRVSEIVAALQAYARAHIVLREVPIREGDTVTGFVDLVSERAYHFEEGKPSALVAMPDSVKAREAEARAELLESYADFDDTLMEELIEDRAPPLAEVYEIAARTVRGHALMPCFLGSASLGHGITRLMKSLRHDAPGVEVAAERLGGALAVGALADVVRHLGKTVLLRALSGPVAAGGRLGGAALGTLTDLDARTALPALAPGEIGLAVKSDHLAGARAFGPEDSMALPAWAGLPAFPYRRVIAPVHEKDDSRLLAALERLAEIDPGLTVAPDAQTGAPVLSTQGPQHLRRLLAKIAADFGIEVSEAPLPPALRETVTRATEIHHRHRKQSGGAGQFADVVVTLGPQPRGTGIAFSESVKGGAVPRNYIPAVEAGAREALAAGPQGFPVVDVAVTLTDGKSHSVDSSDHAFRTAGAGAVREALAELGTTLLQPIEEIEIHAPSVFSGALVPVATGLKGQVLGFEADPGTAGWDLFRMTLPMVSEEALHAAIAGATRGTGWFESRFDHYQEARREELGDLVAS